MGASCRALIFPSRERPGYDPIMTAYVAADMAAYAPIHEQWGLGLLHSGRR